MQDKLEILAEIKGLKDLFNEKFENNDKSHEDILEQVKKTNGRVSCLEIWQNRIIGGFVVSNIIFLPIIFIIIKNWIEK